MNLFKSMSFYTLTAMLNSAVPFLLLPVFTAYLTPSDYGVLSTFTTIMAFLSPLVFLGISTIVGIDYFKMSTEELAKEFGSLLFIPFLSVLLLTVIFIVFKNPIALFFSLPSEWIVFLPLMTLLTLLPQTLSVLYRSKNEPLKYATLEISQSLLSVGLSVLFVVGIGMHWQGRMYALAIVGILFSAASYFLISRMSLIHWNFSKLIIKNGLKFGFGLAPHSLGNLIIRMSDRLFIVAIIGLSDAGQYAVGIQVAGIMLILVSTFNQAWSPYLFHNLSSTTVEKKRMLVKYSYIVIFGFFIFAIILNLVTPFIYRFFIASKFHESMKFVPWMTLGFFFTAVYLTFVNYIFYEKKTHILSIITIFNTILNLSLNYIFIHRFGAIGATYAYAISMFFVMCLAWILSNKIYHMPWLYWLKKENNAN